MPPRRWRHTVIVKGSFAVRGDEAKIESVPFWSEICYAVRNVAPSCHPNGLVFRVWKQSFTVFHFPTYRDRPAPCLYLPVSCWHTVYPIISSLFLPPFITFFLNNTVFESSADAAILGTSNRKPLANHPTPSRLSFFLFSGLVFFCFAIPFFFSKPRHDFITGVGIRSLRFFF